MMKSISAVKKGPKETVVTCSHQDPLTGERCGSPSFDGITARCDQHAGDHPTEIGLKAIANVPKRKGRGTKRRSLPP